jgi:distribution and morphology protein 31
MSLARLGHATRATVDRYSAIRLFFIRDSRNNVRFNHSDAKQRITKPPGVDQKLAEPHSHLPPLNLDNYPRLYRRLALSLSHLHRPTRDDFLKVANGFWQRLRIRFKWFTIRSFRKFNADDISAFVTWFLMSQTLWILVGT